MRPSSDQTTLGFSTTTAAALPREAPVLRLLPMLTLLSHPSLERVGERGLLSELVSGREALLSRHRPRFGAPRSPRSRPLEDRFLSRKALRFEALPDGAVRVHRDGSPTRVRIEGAPLAEVAELAAASLAEGVVLELAQRIVLLLHVVPPPPAEPPPDFGLVGESDGIVRVRQAIARVASLDIPVLLTGETGTGKELVARALHANSRRSRGPFVGVNLGALPPSLAAAELFGSKKGAFTGAVVDQPGYFGRADGGTLFLDEVGDAPPEIQVMLLRALETSEIVPVGGQKPRRVDVRVVSATDADLEKRVQEGGFRAPLLHRLAGYHLPLPPLRRRRDDIGRLLLCFLIREMEGLGETPPNDPEALHPWLPAALAARLAREPWPGNVRQLENVARQLVIESRGLPTLAAAPRLADPPRETGRAAGPSTPFAETTGARARRRPSRISEAELLAALRENRWELKATARALGIARTSLYDRMRRSPAVRPASDVTAEEIRRAFEHRGGELAAMMEDLEVSERALRQRLKDLGLRSTPR